jgi:uncharacterized membrane protein
MKQARFINWLHAQLPDLVAAGVLSESSAEALRRHYGPPARTSGMPLALLFCGVLGALLIGAGIILLFAHNWHAMSRPARVLLSFLPLVLVQALTGWVLLRRNTSTVWREATGGLHLLCVGAAIALVAQTYHMPGSFDTFMLTWMLLGLPLIYLLQAVTPLLFYFAGITAWAGYQQDVGEHALLFWPLAAASLPFVWRTIWTEAASPRALLVQWGGMLTLTCVLGIVLEKVVPGLWIPIYACYFTALYLAGGLVTQTWATNWWRQPARVYGASATIVLLFILSWSWPWEAIGWQYPRVGGRFHADAAWMDGLLGLALLTIAVALLVGTIRRRRAADLLLGAAAPLALVAYVVTAATDLPGLSVLLINVYLLGISIGWVIQGVRAVRLRVFNGGMGLFSALLVARFFDSDFSFVAKGLVFIALGVLLLVCNVLLSRAKERRLA